jgi:flagellar hook-length control protein FliK
MQLDFTPMPAAGDLATVEVPPTNGGPPVEAPSDASGNLSQTSASAGSQKGFRETMDELLGAVPSGETGEEGQAVPREADAGETAESETELTLVETAVQPVNPPQQETLDIPLPKLAGGTEPADGEVASAAQIKAGRPIVSESDKPQVALTSKATPKVAPGQNIIRVPETPEGLKPETAIKTLEGMAAKPLIGERGGEQVVAAKVSGEQVVAAKVSGASVEGHDLRAVQLSHAGTAQATTVSSPSREAGTGTNPTAAGDGSKLGLTLDGAPRGQQSQDTPDQGNTSQGNSGQRTAPQMDMDTTATEVKPAAVKEGQPPPFTALVEGLEKGGGEGKPLGASVNVDAPTDTVASSAPKSVPTSQSEGASGFKSDPAPAQPLAKEEIVQQIVSSAKLRFSNGQNEIRIQLKPEHLGQVRLNITTDQQQVMVKVVAELPVVKELLETNLPQLRSELQGQGLEIDKFDVSVGGDAETQNKEQQTWGQRRSNGRGGTFAQAEEEHQDQGTASDNNPRQQNLQDAATEGVDYFA